MVLHWTNKLFEKAFTFLTEWTILLNLQLNELIYRLVRKQRNWMKIDGNGL